MDLSLGGRVCLVTGASEGIGRGAAGILAREGCRVAVAARNADRLESLAAEIAAQGRERPLPIALDLTSPDAADMVVRRIEETFGRLEILVNNAGTSWPVDWNAGEDEWQRGMALNFDAVRRLTQRALPGMRERGWGRVINVTGTSEPRGVNVASAAKAAIHAWSKGLSCAVARDGITVNCLAPGRIESQQILHKLHPDPGERERFAAAHIPVGYFGTPDDTGHLIAFLASPLARYITGEIIHVDGGMRHFAY